MSLFVSIKSKIHSPVLKNSIIYMVTDGIARAISFLLLPLTSKYLLPEELGIAANFDVLQSILVLLAGQAIVNALPYFYYKLTKEKVALWVSSMIGIVLMCSFIFTIAIIFSTDIIEKYLKIGLALQLLTIVSVIAQLLSDLNKIIFRLEDKPYQFAILQVIQTVFYTLLMVYMVVGLRMQALGRIYSAVISVSVLCVIHVIIMIKKGFITFHYEWQTIKDLLKFGIPLLPHSLSFWVKSGMDKILLTTYCGLVVNGLYSMAMSFGGIYSMCQIAFSRAYVPYLQKRLAKMNSENEQCEKRNIVRMTYRLGLLFILLYFILVFICWLAMQYMLDPKYLPSFQFIPYILLARTIHAFYSLTVEYIYTAKKTFGLGIITFTGSIIQFLLTFTLVNLFSENGIKISIVLGELIIMLGVWIYSNKVYPLPWFHFGKTKK